MDDCSTDNSVEVIRSFQDPRIAGYLAAQFRYECRRGALHAAPVPESMLRIFPAMISGSRQSLRNKSPFWNGVHDAVFTQVKVVGEDGEALKANRFMNPFDYENKSPEEWLRRFFYFGNCLCNPSVMIRRSVYEKFGYQDKRLVSLSDFDLWVKFSFEHRFWILNQQLTMFRVRDNGMNLSANNPGNQRRQFFEFKQILITFLLFKKRIN
ncbi:MAG: hypothetical protein R2881_02940 [Eubacteriales bacterium]